MSFPSDSDSKMPEVKTHRTALVPDTEAARVGTITPLSKINGWLDSAHFMFWMLGGVTIIYLIAYLGHPVLPGNDPKEPLGWWGWWDQGKYLKCAADLAHGRLTRDSYWYPLGYPLTGAIFYRWMPQHPFLIPNLAFVLGSTVLFYKIARRLISPLETVLLMGLFAFWYSGILWIALVEPWSTIPTHFLSYFTAFLVAFRPPDLKRVLAASLCVGLIFLCRPGDALCLAALPGIAILGLSSCRERLTAAAATLAILGAFAVAVLLVNHAVFDSWRTQYDQIAAQVGFCSYSIPRKIFFLLFDGETLFREPDAALARHFPWMILFIPGAVYLLLRYKTLALGTVLSIAATHTMYFLFNDFWPSTVFRYHAIHYLVWTLPLAALVSYLALKEAWKFKLGLLSYFCVAAFLFALSFIRQREEVVATIPAPGPNTVVKAPATNQRIDWLLFEGSDVIPDLKAAGKTLVRKRDYEDSLRPDGGIVLLSEATRKHPIEFDSATITGIRQVHYGTLKWEIGWFREAR